MLTSKYFQAGTCSELFCFLLWNPQLARSRLSTGKGGQDIYNFVNPKFDQWKYFRQHLTTQLRSWTHCQRNPTRTALSSCRYIHFIVTYCQFVAYYWEERKSLEKVKSVQTFWPGLISGCPFDFSFYTIILDNDNELMIILHNKYWIMIMIMLHNKYWIMIMIILHNNTG